MEEGRHRDSGWVWGRTRSQHCEDEAGGLHVPPQPQPSWCTFFNLTCSLELSTWHTFPSVGAGRQWEWLVYSKTSLPHSLSTPALVCPASHPHVTPLASMQPGIQWYVRPSVVAMETSPLSIFSTIFQGLLRTSCKQSTFRPCLEVPKFSESGCRGHAHSVLMSMLKGRRGYCQFTNNEQTHPGRFCPTLFGTFGTRTWTSWLPTLHYFVSLVFCCCFHRIFVGPTWPHNIE